MKTISRLLVVSAATLAAVVSTADLAFAQRGGGGGGGGRGGAAISAIPSSQSRLDTIDKAFELTKEQKKAVKALLDDAHKNAAAARDGLTKTHAAIGAAVQANKGQAEIDAAVKSYAEQTAVMASHEMKALADLIKLLNDTQRANNAAISSTFFLLRGAFLDPKKWDDIPSGKNY